MSGELRLSMFRYSTTQEDDFVIGSPYNAALKTPKYLVFQVNQAMGYGSNPHLRCQWMDGLNSWRLRFSHDGITVNDFALTNAENDFLASNTFSGPVSFNNTVSFTNAVGFTGSATAVTVTHSDNSNNIATTAHVKQVIQNVTVNSSTNTVVTNDVATNTTVYPTWVAWSSYDPNGYFPQKVSNTKLFFNPSTGVLSSTTFSGSGALLTNIPANQLTGTFSAVSFNLGTTSIVMNRASAEMGLTGITSLTGSTVSIGTTTATAINVGTGAVTNTTTVDGTILNVGTSKASTINLGTASTTQTINIGTGSGVTTINLGGSGDTVNIAGTLTYVNTTDLNVTDKLITLNKGGAAASGNSAGIAVEENGSAAAGYIQVGNSRASWDLKVPSSTTNGFFRFTPNPTYITEIIPESLTANRVITLPNASGTVSLVGHTHGIGDVTDATVLGSNLVKFTNPNAITFIRINANNTVSALDAVSFRTAIGAGTSSTVGTVTSVSGTGSVSGLSLSGTVTDSGNITLGGILQVANTDFAPQAANAFLAGPISGGNVTPTFRSIQASDVPNLDASKITTGVFAVARIPTVALANALSTTRTITANGDISWTVSFDGSANVSASASISSPTVTGKLLTGLPASTTGTVTAADSILTAFSKLQTQVTTVSGVTLANLTLSNSGSGANSGATYNGSSAVTISYNSVGAAPAVHTHSEYSLTSHNHSGVYANATHSHEISDVTNLSNALAGKSDTTHNHTGVYATSSHGHAIADITNLQNNLNNKADTGHTHTLISNALQINGALTVTQDITAFYSSDERLKDEITNLQNALDTVVKLQGVSYKWNDTYKEVSGLDIDQDFTHYGFIAQEVQKVIPEMVIERDNGYLALDYDKVAPLLVEALKEQQKQINELRLLIKG